MVTLTAITAIAMVAATVGMMGMMAMVAMVTMVAVGGGTDADGHSQRLLPHTEDVRKRRRFLFKLKCVSTSDD